MTIVVDANLALGLIPLSSAKETPGHEHGRSLRRISERLSVIDLDLAACGSFGRIGALRMDRPLRA